MEGLLWLLVWGAVFYFMMRFGCGSHMVHGGHGAHGSGGGAHGSHSSRAGTDATTKDPVCGMTVAPDSGYSRMYQGQEYRLCSRKCLDQFDADPARYASGRGDGK
jgi:YHS domain-containing protein